jgi:hypothetical protein
VKKIKNIKLEEDEILVLFYAEALFPSIPFKKCIKVMETLLKSDHSLSSRTPLTSDDLIDLINLCLSTSNFVYNSRHHTATDSGPIRLSLMVIIAEIWMDFSLKEAIKLAKKRGIAVPCKLSIYMDDTFGILRQNATKNAHVEFAACLTDVDPRLKFTFETEKNKNSLSWTHS